MQELNPLKEIIKDAYPKRYELFNSAAEKHELHHAYLFYGAKGSGQNTFAQWVASECIQKPIINVQNETIIHPDIVLLESHGKSITVDQIRSIQTHLSSKPSIATWKVAVILDAEHMTDQAANALLKVVEEPPKDSIILLSTAAADQIVAPLLSRCQKLFIPPISHSAASSVIRQYRNGADVEKIVHLADGGVDNINILLHNKSAYDDKSEMISFWSSFLSASTADRREMVNKRYLKAKNSKEQVHTINLVLDVLARLLQEAITEQHVSATHEIPNYTVKQVYARLRLLERIRSMVAQNVNKKSIFEYLITGI